VSARALRERFGTFPNGVAVPWVVVAIMAVTMSFVDGFWIVSLREAAGAAVRTGRPFASWLADSTAVVPLFALAILAALAFAYERYGPVLRRPRAVITTSLLIALAGTVAAMVVALSSTGYDYYLQATAAEKVETTHGHGAAISPDDPTCTGSCAVQRATLEVHARGLTYLAPLVLGTNLVLVGWLVALRGGRLDAPTARARRELEPTA
jgi:hypothetical protein